MRFTDDIPGEFKDEERWFKFFPRNVAIMLLVSLAVGFGIVKAFEAITGHFVVPLIIVVLFTIFLGYIMMKKKDSSDVMRGGGQSIFYLWIYKAYRRKNRKIYVKGLGDRRN